MGADRSKRLRCAVYARKSTEEGLDQAFNSLDAQREACEAYIRSQASEGWTLVKARYDDGGISGGTMDRPALLRLLADIRERKVDTVVVYKVDRLTRSLADFAKIVEVFDTHGVSFVSVTQQFNTTTSMGRLTLNMLLSFAQFEREVTGERIRDKIAASKKKGMWMGGFVPLGYDAKDRTLVVNQAEAETVRVVFRLYLDHGNVRRVKDEANRLGLRTKIRQDQEGRTLGSRPLSRGYIYKLLANPIYIGKIVHGRNVYDGKHEPLIDPETWQAVQAKLAGSACARRSTNGAKEPSLLLGLIYDEHGNRLSPSHAVKNGKRYRYYISSNLLATAREANDVDGFRIPAYEIERLITETIERLLLQSSRLFDLLGLEGESPSEVRAVLECARRIAVILRNRGNHDAVAAIRTLVSRVTVRQDEILIDVSAAGLREQLGMESTPLNASEPYSINIPARLKRCGGASRLIVADDEIETDRGPDPASVKLLSRAHDWLSRLTAGQAESAAEIAREEGLTRSYVTRVLRLAFLAPNITEAILDGRHPPELNAERLVRRSRLPLAWHDQRRILGFGRH